MSLDELAEICDVQRRDWQEGNPRLAEAYLAENPKLGSNPDWILELVYNEILLREARRETPPLAEYEGRFPGLASRLKSLFEIHQVLESDSLAEVERARQAETWVPSDTPARDRPEAPLFAGYEILDELGRGGMGVVYRARQVSLDRFVALKMLRTDRLASTAEVARMRREAEAVAQLDHPHIVPIYEVGESGGRPYFSMKLCEGGSLTSQLPRLQKNPRAAAAVMATLARAVHHAHQRGILHRDLKPANILLDHEGQPLVSDFGLATRLSLTTAGTQASRQSKEIAGTPSYMAPEQATPNDDKGDALALNRQAVTTTTDVYSLGAILYEILTGRPPFRGDTPLQTLEQVRHGQMQQPEALNPAIPRDLALICRKCLARNPDERYLSAEALAEDLERWTRGVPIRARDVGWSESVWMWAKRRPLVAGLGAAAMLFLLTTLGVGLTGVMQIEAANQQLKNTIADLRESVREAKLQRARSLLLSSVPGRSRLARSALEEAAAIRIGVDLRNEYARALDTADLERVRDFRAGDESNANQLQARPDANESARTAEAWKPADWWIMGRANLLANGERLGAFHAGRAVEFDSITGDVMIEAAGPANKRWALRSPDGRRIVTWARNQRGALLHDTRAKDGPALPLLNQQGQNFAPRCFVFSSRSDRLATAYRAGDDLFRIIIFNIVSGKPEVAHEWQVPAFELDCLRFSPDGAVLAGSLGVSGDLAFHGVQLWQMPNGIPLLSSPILLDRGAGWDHCQRPQRLDFSADGRMLVAAGNKGTIRVFDVATVGRQAALPETFAASLAPHSAHNVSFSPDTRSLITLDTDHTLQVREMPSGQIIVQAPLNASLPSSSRGTGVTADSIGIITDIHPEKDEGLRLWQFTRSMSRLYALQSHEYREANEFLDALLFSADDRWLVASRPGQGSPWLIDLDRPNVAAMPLAANPGPCALAFDDARNALWCVSHSGAQRTWDLPSGEAKLARQGSSLPLAAMACNARGERIVAALSAKQPLLVRNLDSGQECGDWSEKINAVARGGSEHAFSLFSKTIRLSRGGGTLVLIDGRGSESTLKAFSLRETKEARLLISAPLRRFANCLAVADDGRLVAVGRGQDIAVFDSRSSHSLTTLTAPNADVVDLAFDRTGTVLAAVSRDGTARLWRPETGEELLALSTRSKSPWRIALSPSGRWLAVGDQQCQVQVWDISQLRARLRQAGLDWQDAVADHKRLD